ncbi:hypothetical protein AOQ73_27745 [Bradyrhizobium pachyrhizi]|nr:hypothetical protein AOQ73_27745 [Bradyrhizobium pachyrhizi]
MNGMPRIGGSVSPWALPDASPSNGSRGAADLAKLASEVANTIFHALGMRDARNGAPGQLIK